MNTIRRKMMSSALVAIGLSAAWVCLPRDFRPLAQHQAAAQDGGNKATAAPLRDSQGRAVVVGEFDDEGDLTLLLKEPSEAEQRLRAHDVLQSLHDRAEQAEQRVADLAKIYRENSDKGDGAKKNRAQLETAVREAFDARQQAQRLEAEILRVRLQRADQRIAQREKTKDAIVARRIQQVLTAESVSLAQKSGAKSADKPKEPPAELSAPTVSSGTTEASTPELLDMGRGRGVSPVAAASMGSRGGRGGRVTGGFGQSPVAMQALLNLPKFQAKSREMQFVGVISQFDPDGKVLIRLHADSIFKVGQELVVSRLDFVHEDGTEQYYNFARILVVQADKTTAVGRLLEWNRESNNPLDALKAEQRLLKEVVPSTFDLTSDDSWLAKLQGEWRMEKLVSDERVRPPGDLKGNRHQLVVNEEWLNFIDTAELKVITRFRFSLEGEIFSLPEGGRTESLRKPINDPSNIRQFHVSSAAKQQNSQASHWYLAFEQNESNLKLAYRNVGAPITKLEPGPDITYMEFSRINPADSAALGRARAENSLEKKPERSPLPAPVIDLRTDTGLFNKFAKSGLKIKFANAPLTEVLAALAKEVEVEINVDNERIAAAKIETTTPVTIDSDENRLLLQNLDSILNPLGLDFKVYRNAIVVTTKEAASNAWKDRLNQLLEFDLQLLDHLGPLPEGEKAELRKLGLTEIDHQIEQIALIRKRIAAVAGDPLLVNGLYQQLTALLLDQFQYGPFLNFKGEFQRTAEKALSLANKKVFPPISRVLALDGKIGTSELKSGRALAVYFPEDRILITAMRELANLPSLGWLRVGKSRVNPADLADLKIAFPGLIIE